MDYDVDQNGRLTNFECRLDDWGIAAMNPGGRYYGGTPLYAGPRSFEQLNKDLFSFGRLATELFVYKTGLS